MQLIARKNDLSTCRDFDEAKLYLHFDEDMNGKITLKEMKRALDLLGLCYNDLDLCLLLKSWDRNSKGYLDYDDFSAIFTNQRKNPSFTLPEVPFPETLTEYSFEQLTNLINAHISSATIIEALKQRLVSEVGVDLNQSFELLAKSRKSCLAAEDVVAC